MRIRIAHETTFSYAPPARFIIQNLRLTPRSFDSQYVMRWRVNVDIDTGTYHHLPGFLQGLFGSGPANGK